MSGSLPVEFRNLLQILSRYAAQRSHIPEDAGFLTLFGLLSVSAMLVFYALENRSSWYVLAFATACAMGSIYGFLQGAWPFGVVEAVWALDRVKALARSDRGSAELTILALMSPELRVLDKLGPLGRSTAHRIAQSYRQARSQA